MHLRRGRTYTRAVAFVDPWPAVDARLELEALARVLTPLQRRALALHLQGHTHAEIGARVASRRLPGDVIGYVLGWSGYRRNSVRWRLLRATWTRPENFASMVVEANVTRAEREAEQEAEALARANRKRERKARREAAARKKHARQHSARTTFFEQHAAFCRLARHWVPAHDAFGDQWNSLEAARERVEREWPKAGCYGWWLG